jgi:hypothetical protein
VKKTNPMNRLSLCALAPILIGAKSVSGYEDRAQNELSTISRKINGL